MKFILTCQRCLLLVLVPIMSLVLLGVLRLFAQEDKPAPAPTVLQEMAMDHRKALRAFYSAPPVIPHEVETQDTKDCLRCHGNVTSLDDGRIAMQTPHPQFSSCLQCHVPQLPGKGKVVGSTWQGLEEPDKGDRWSPVSPPTIPHRLFLRDNCLSCHGPENPNMRMRTPHPQYSACVQCHVPDYHKEFTWSP